MPIMTDEEVRMLRWMAERFQDKFEPTKMTPEQAMEELSANYGFSKDMKVCRAAFWRIQELRFFSGGWNDREVSGRVLMTGLQELRERDKAAREGSLKFRIKKWAVGAALAVAGAAIMGLGTQGATAALTWAGAAFWATIAPLLGDLLKSR